MQDAEKDKEVEEAEILKNGLMLIQDEFFKRLDKTLKTVDVLERKYNRLARIFTVFIIGVFSVICVWLYGYFQVGGRDIHYQNIEKNEGIATQINNQK